VDSHLRGGEGRRGKGVVIFKTRDFSVQGGRRGAGAGGIPIPSGSILLFQPRGSHRHREKTFWEVGRFQKVLLFTKQTDAPYRREGDLRGGGDPTDWRVSALYENKRVGGGGGGEKGEREVPCEFEKKESLDLGNMVGRRAVWGGRGASKRGAEEKSRVQKKNARRASSMLARRRENRGEKKRELLRKGVHSSGRKQRSQGLRDLGRRGGVASSTNREGKSVAYLWGRG